MSKEYYKERNEKNIIKLRALLTELPAFCREFFLGIENRTSVLTRIGYAYDLRIFFDFLSKEICEFVSFASTDFTLKNLEEISPTHLEMYLQYLSLYEFNGKKYQNSEGGKARKLACIKTMYKYFFKKESIPIDIAAKVDLPKMHHKEIIRLEVDEVSKLLNEVESGDNLTKRQLTFHESTKYRDLALITLLLGTGMRISECVGLNIEDIDFNSQSVKIIRKGGGESILYLSDEVCKAISSYLELRNVEISKLEKRNNIKEIKNNALFLSLQGNRINVRSVQLLVKKYAKQVTPLKHITPHKLRSTYGTSLYRETKDIYIVADVLGHKDVNTTKKHYAAISDEIRRSAANKVKLRED